MTETKGNIEETRKGNEVFDFNSHGVLTYKEIIVQQLNYWRNKHIERVMSFHEAVARREKHPKAMIVVGTNPQTGQDKELSITAICEKRLPAAIESKFHVKTLETMLTEVEKSEDALAESWSDESLVAPAIESPLSGEKKDDDTEETK